MATNDDRIKRIERLLSIAAKIALIAKIFLDH